MSLEARIAKVVAASAACGAAPAWGAGGASSDAEWDSCDDAERPSGGGDGEEEEEEEEVLEIDEAQVLALLDADEAALCVCQRLFLPPPPPGALQLLPGACCAPRCGAHAAAPSVALTLRATQLLRQSGCGATAGSSCPPSCPQQRRRPLALRR